MKKILFILNKKQKIQLLFLCIIILLGAFLETFSIAAILPVLYVVIDKEKLLDIALVKKIYEILGLNSINNLIILIIIGVGVVFILKGVLLLYRNYIKFAYINQTQYNIASRMMICYIKQPYMFHVNNNSADIQRNIINDVGNFVQFMLALLDSFVYGVLGAFLLIYMLYIDSICTLSIAGIFGIFILVAFRPMNKNLKDFGEKARTSGGKMVQWIMQSLNGIKELKIYKNEQYFIDKFKGEYSIYADAQKKQQFTGSIPSIFFEVVCILIVLGVVVVKLINGDDTSEIVTTISMIAVIGMKLLTSAGGGVTSVTRMSFLYPSVEQLYSDLTELEKLEENLEECESGYKGTEFEKLELKDVSFRYPDMETWIVNNIDLKFQRGQAIGIIGPSGAGKTTFVDLILGILPLTKGSINIKYKEVCDNFAGEKSLFAYIPQTIYLMDDTIRNNIAYGIEEKDIDDNAVWRALERAQLIEHVKGLPDGLDTLVGECGIKLSGGQRQRVGIARALYRNPEILILDEATSALDSETESAIMETFESLYGQITLIIIAHRISTLKGCDAIFEVQAGEVKQREKGELFDE